MNGEMVESKSESKDLNNNKSSRESISVRLARYLEHIRHLKRKNTKNLYSVAKARIVQQQELHNKDLNELREQYETQLQANRENLEKVLKTKLKSAEIEAQREKDALDHSKKTLRLKNNLIVESESRLYALERTNSTLNETVRNLQASVKMEHSMGNKLAKEVERLQKKLASKIEEYEQLVKEETETALGHEIAKFNQLLSQEEKRIKMSASKTQLLAGKSANESLC